MGISDLYVQTGSESDHRKINGSDLITMTLIFPHYPFFLMNYYYYSSRCNQNSRICPKQQDLTKTTGSDQNNRIRPKQPDPTKTTGSDQNTRIRPDRNPQPCWLYTARREARTPRVSRPSHDTYSRR